MSLISRCFHSQYKAPNAVFSFLRCVPQLWASSFENKILIQVPLSRLLFSSMYFKVLWKYKQDYSLFPELNIFNQVSCLKQGTQNNATCVWLCFKRNTAFLFLSLPVPQPSTDPWGSVKFPQRTYLELKRRNLSKWPSTNWSVQGKCCHSFIGPLSCIAIIGLFSHTIFFALDTKINRKYDNLCEIK